MYVTVLKLAMAGKFLKVSLGMFLGKVTSIHSDAADKYKTRDFYFYDKNFMLFTCRIFKKLENAALK